MAHVDTGLAALPPGRTRLDTVAVGGVLACCLCWGVQQVTTKIALAGGLPPLFQATIRSALASLLLLAFLAARGQLRTTLRLNDGTLRPGLLIALLFAAEFLFLFPGVARTSASRAVLLLFTSPFFTALAAHYLLPSERLNGPRVAGLLVAFAGVACAASDRSGGGATWQGDLLVLVASICLGLNTVIVKASPALARATAGKVLLWQVGGSVPTLAAAAALAGEAAWPHASQAAWLALLYQSAIVAFLSYLGWFWLVARYPAGRLAAFTFLTPLIGIATSALVLAEPTTLRLLGGTALVGLGLALVNRN